MTDTIQNGAVVSLAYTLKLANGEVIDYTEADDPLEYLHGADNIIPGLERELAGLHVGDQRDVRVAPADGYGEYDPTEVEEIPSKELPKGVNLRVGMVVAIPDDDGNLNEAMVREITPTHVTLDFNHPLAGQPLFFSVEVVGIREATPDELEQGHPDSLEFEDDFEDFEEFDEDDFDEDDEDWDDEDFDEYDEEGDDAPSNRPTDPKLN
jgi:FKBP-type peptidyl-prolyl cis-trans isomerase SlyD